MKVFILCFSCVVVLGRRGAMFGPVQLWEMSAELAV